MQVNGEDAVGDVGGQVAAEVIAPRAGAQSARRAAAQINSADTGAVPGDIDANDLAAHLRGSVDQPAFVFATALGRVTEAARAAKRILPH